MISPRRTPSRSRLVKITRRVYSGRDALQLSDSPMRTGKRSVRRWIVEAPGWAGRALTYARRRLEPGGRSVGIILRPWRR